MTGIDGRSDEVVATVAEGGITSDTVVAVGGKIDSKNLLEVPLQHKDTLP